MSQYKKQFIELFDEYHSGIYRFLRVKLPRDEIAQDLASETFLRAWDYIQRNPDNYPENPRAYLYKTAYNCLVDYYRKRKEELPMKNEIIESIDKLRENDIVGTVFGKSDIVETERIFNQIQQLSGDSAQLITLKYIEDLSNSEIADILGKNEGAVRTGLSRALKQLRSRLGDDK